MTSQLPTPNSQRRRGLTLTEVVVSSVFVGMLIVAALNVTEIVLRMRLDAAEQNDAHLLAEELMTEILQAYYKDPGAGSGGSGTRADFDDLDDYHGWSASPPQQKDGTPVPNAAGWRRSVAVDWVQPTDPNATSGSDFGLKRITVTVTGPTGRVWTLTGLRAERGLLELKPPLDATYVTHGTIALQPTAGESRRTAAAIANDAKDTP